MSYVGNVETESGDTGPGRGSRNPETRSDSLDSLLPTPRSSKYFNHLRNYFVCRNISDRGSTIFVSAIASQSLSFWISNVGRDS